jgi:CubicO group peptidase (beta-lactamase class C family)
MNCDRLGVVRLEDRIVAAADAVPTVAPPTDGSRVALVSSPPEVAADHVARPNESVFRDLEVIRDRAGVPALAGGIILDGQLTEIAAVGVREQGGTKSVRADDVFHLGSNGKAMTATLAAILVERGVIKWTTTLEEAFPEFRRSMNVAYRKVTLEDLLNHRSGLPTMPSDALSERVLAFKAPPMIVRWRFTPALLRESPVVPAGEFNYSNVGYTVAAAMMERMAGRPYESMMSRFIFRPLGMTSAGFGEPPQAKGCLSNPVGHIESGEPINASNSIEFPAALNPAGLVHMNLHDWSKFLRVHLGEKVNGIRLLSEASLMKLHTPDPREVPGLGGKYGFGWVTIESPLGRVLTHDGSNDYWYSSAVLLPAKKAAVFAATNQGGEAAGRAVLEVADQVIELFAERLKNNTVK